MNSINTPRKNQIMKHESVIELAFKKLLVLLMLTSLFGCSSSAFSTNPEHISSATSDIADFDIIAGYTLDFTASLLGYTMAAFNPGDGHSHLYLIQSKNASDGEDLIDKLEEMAPGAFDPDTRMRVVETRQETVRNQEVTLVISEGTNYEGVVYRQVMAAFQGKAGPALLVLSEPITRWDQTAVDAFLRSIR